MDSKEVLLDKLEVDSKEGLLDIKAQPEDGSKEGFLDKLEVDSMEGLLDIKAQPEGGSKEGSLDIKVHMEAGSRELLGTKAGRLEGSPTRGSAQAIPEGLPTRGRSQVEIGLGSNRATPPSRRKLPMTLDISSTATKTASSGSLGSATTFRQSVLSCTIC